MSEDEDGLIMCESKTCKIQWFHIKCMRIKKITKGKRFCVKFKTKKDNCGNKKQLKNISTRFIHFFIGITFTGMYRLKFFKMLA